MFLIEKLYIKEGKLEAFLEATSELVAEMDPPRLVTMVGSDVAAKVGWPLRSLPKGTTKKELFIKALKASKGKSFTNDGLRTVMKSVNANPSAVNFSFLQELVKAKVLKKQSRGVYTVL